MPETLGYMVTWTTYGTWLQGEKKGYVKKGKVLSGSDKLRRANIERLSQEPVRLSVQEKRIVRQAILEKAQQAGQRIFAIAVCSNHVHIMVGYDGRPVEQTVRRYKNVATAALRAKGMSGKVWTKGYDKRYCFEEKSLRARIAYVETHNLTEELSQNLEC